MKILYVVQRYGEEVAGGAEAYCRMFAERMVERGHEVSVATTTAKNYVDWAPYYDARKTKLNNVDVYRFSVERTRNDQSFSEINTRTVWQPKPVPLFLQEEWMESQGPYVPALVDWLREHATEFDVVVFITYLYWTTWAGMKEIAGRVPVVLHLTAHDEPPIKLPLFKLALRIPDALVFSTIEELQLMRDQLGIKRLSSVVGVGDELLEFDGKTNFRQEFPQLGDRPYLLYVGRIGPEKGTDELFDFFKAYKERNPGDLALVLVGDPVRPLPEHEDVIVTGFVSDEIKRAAIHDCLMLVQPSYFESFSIALTETWTQRKPAIVQGNCDVLAGQCVRSGGGIPYSNFAEFELAVQMLIDDPALGEQLGNAGRSYVESNYTWDEVMSRYETLLEKAVRLRYPSSV